MATHISAAAADLNSLLVRVEGGEEIIIESNSRPIAVLRRPEFPGRSISETNARADASFKELVYAPVMDADFAADLEEIIRNRKPHDTSVRD